MTGEQWAELFSFYQIHVQGHPMVDRNDYDKVADKLKITLAQNAILRKALSLHSAVIADQCDRLEIENFGAATEFSVVIAEAAFRYGVANSGDSAFDLAGMTADQAYKINKQVTTNETAGET